MFPALKPASTIIDTVRLRCRATPTAVQVRTVLQRRLEAAELIPAEIPPAAILMVRSLKATLPYPVNVSLSRIDRTWEHVAQSELRALYQRAERPIRGPIPLRAEAIAFGDLAEMLACFARDLVLGQARQRWWWRALLNRRGEWTEGQWLRWSLADDPPHLPGVLELLDRWRLAGRVLVSLAQRELPAVWAALAETLPVRDLVPSQSVTALWQPADAKTQSAQSPGLGPEHSDASQSSAAGDVVVKPPWADWLSHDPNVATCRDLQTLRGLALTYRRDPVQLFRPRFRRELLDWWKAADDRNDAPRSGRFAAQGHPTEASTRPTDAPDQGTIRNSTIIRAEVEFPVDRQATRDDRPTDSSLFKLVASAGGQETPAPDARRARKGEGQRETPPQKTPPLAEVEPPIEVDAQPPCEELVCSYDGARPWEADGTETQFAGLLFLINVLTHLGLDRRAPGFHEPVGCWALLEVIGRALLSDAADADRDPIWRMLAALDRRADGALPRLPSGLAEVYEVPLDWLCDLPDDEPCHWAGGSRWRMWSPRGFVLLEGPSSRLAAAGPKTAPGVARLQRARPLQRRPAAEAPLECIEGPLVRELAAPWKRWLAVFVPLLRYRVGRALGAASLARETIAAEVLRRRGRIYMATSHLDLVMPLDDASLAIRQSGLDRDPGWLPAFGRVVKFHFC